MEEEKGITMDTCERCGRGGVRLAMEVLPVYRDTNIGIDGVVLRDAVLVERCAACKEIVETTIPNPAGLMAAVAITRAKHALKLNGKEIRFLRLALGLTAKDLAHHLEVEPETLS
jgi:hypothetical protein